LICTLKRSRVSVRHCQRKVPGRRTPKRLFPPLPGQEELRRGRRAVEHPEDIAELDAGEQSGLRPAPLRTPTRKDTASPEVQPLSTSSERRPRRKMVPAHEIGVRAGKRVASPSAVVASSSKSKEVAQASKPDRPPRLQISPHSRPPSSSHRLSPPNPSEAKFVKITAIGVASDLPHSRDRNHNHSHTQSNGGNITPISDPGTSPFLRQHQLHDLFPNLKFLRKHEHEHKRSHNRQPKQQRKHNIKFYQRQHHQYQYQYQYNQHQYQIHIQRS